CVPVGDILVEEQIAVENVSAGAPDDNIIPKAAHEHVVLVATDQRIVQDGPEQVLDAVIGVAGGDTGVARRISKIGRDAGIDVESAVGVAHRVSTIPALEAGIAADADQQVVANASDEGVVAALTKQDVIAARADERVIDTNSPGDDV